MNNLTRSNIVNSNKVVIPSTAYEDHVLRSSWNGFGILHRDRRATITRNNKPVTSMKKLFKRNKDMIINNGASLAIPMAMSIETLLATHMCQEWNNLALSEMDPMTLSMHLLLYANGALVVDITDEQASNPDLIGHAFDRARKKADRFTPKDVNHYADYVGSGPGVGTKLVQKLVESLKKQGGFRKYIKRAAINRPDTLCQLHNYQDLDGRGTVSYLEGNCHWKLQINDKYDNAISPNDPTTLQHECPSAVFTW